MAALRRTKEERPFNVGGLIVALALPGLCLLLVLPAILSNNLLFATDWVLQEPEYAVIFYKGDTYIFEPGDPEYDSLVEVCNTTLAHENGFVEWGWSDQRFEQARTEGIAVELIYGDPVKVPGSRMDIGDMYRLFFPLEVHGFSGEVVFRGGESEYWGNPIRVETLDWLREMVEQIISDQQARASLPSS